MPRWREHELKYLENHAGDGAAAIAHALGRSIVSVQVQASRMGLSLCRRYLCPRCGKYSGMPMSQRTGWCRTCTVNDSAESAALKNREVRMQLAEERRRIKEAEQRRQAIYSDTNRKKKELRRLRER